MRIGASVNARARCSICWPKRRTTAVRLTCAIQSSSTRAISRHSVSTRSSSVRSAGRASIRASRPSLRGASIRLRRKAASAGQVRCRHSDEWPARAVVQAFADEADRQVLHALTCEDLDRPGHPLLDRAEAAFAIVEHELMHQETLLYMWHQLPHHQKRRPVEYVSVIDGPAPSADWVEVSGGGVTLGVDREAIKFGWDNECPRHAMQVGAFRMQRLDVTNATVSRVRGCWRLRRAAVVAAGGLDVVAARQDRPPAVLGARRRCLVVARHVRVDSAARVVARVCESRRSVGIRAVGRSAAPDGSRVPARGVRRSRRRGTYAPMG